MKKVLAALSLMSMLFVFGFANTSPGTADVAFGVPTDPWPPIKTTSLQGDVAIGGVPTDPWPPIKTTSFKGTTA